ncbi:MAG: biotin/lipoyl-containing protein, partial [Myxococcota bacterium]
MAAFELKLPDIGEGVHEGEIVAWHVKPGDRVAEDDPFVEVMTDKATVTIGAPKAGEVRELRFGVGDTARVGQVLAVLETEAAGAADAEEAQRTSTRHAEETQERAATAVGDIQASLPGTGAYPAERTTGRVKAPPPGGDGDGYFCDKPLATPATRKLARELGVDLRRVRPTRADGRVTKDDVRRQAGQGGP